MGQYWQIINIDKRQTMGHWGKLGECLFDTSPDALIHPLRKLMPAEHEEEIKLQKENSGRRNYTSKIDSAGAWIGDRIICIGDYHVDSELPKIPPHDRNLLTEEEEQEIRDARGKDKDVLNLYAFAMENYQKFRHPTNGWFHDDLVLRNLTTREYVRDAAIPRALHGRFCAMGIGEALLARICWSPTDDDMGDTNMSYAGGIHKGVWAGHRFDIMPIEELESLDGAAKWKDVSEDLAREIDAIWTCAYGEMWSTVVHNVRPLSTEFEISMLISWIFRRDAVVSTVVRRNAKAKRWKQSDSLLGACRTM